jgi:hypothetical protein
LPDQGLRGRESSPRRAARIDIAAATFRPDDSREVEAVGALLDHEFLSIGLVARPLKAPCAARNAAANATADLLDFNKETPLVGFCLPLISGQAVDEALRLLGQAGEEALFRGARVEAGEEVSVALFLRLSALIQ